MSKVFRLYKGSDTIVDWQNSVVYGTTAINQITDPDAKSFRKEITSIPSPFARMDLVKSAFAYVANCGDLHGNTIYHKMVSDSLDVAQLFFQYERFRDKLDIIIWDKDAEIKKLRSSRNRAHRAVGETLDMYMQQDDKTYNFSKMSRIYLLRYKGPGRRSQMDIIGATSPATLFFSTANDLSYISNHLQFDRDKAFDTQLCSLDKREGKFIEFFFALQRAYDGFYNDFPEVNEYLDQTYKLLPNEMKDIIEAQKDDAIDDFPRLEVKSNYVDINGFQYRRFPDDIKVDSGFEIRSSIYEGTMPLALPVVASDKYANIKYTNSPWGKEQYAPLTDNRPLDARTLPFVGNAYPYLTIGDLLEDKLVRVDIGPTSKDYAKNYFDGNLKVGKNSCYLLPLKSMFFDFFTADEVRNKVNGLPMIEIDDSIESSVFVKLRIPIKDGGFIEYQKQYIVGESFTNNDVGEIVQRQFAVGLFSNVRFNQENDAYYRVSLISMFDENSEYSVDFYHKGQKIQVEKVIRNESYSKYSKSQTYVLERKSFDFCRIYLDGIGSGILIPTFQEQNGTDEFTFAIDLGTTNTHVEYSVNNSNPKPLDILNDGILLKLWGNVRGLHQNVLDFDLVPQTVGSQSLFRFPMRTALSESKNTNWNQAVYALANVNIPFPLEKKQGYDYNRIITDLKWSSDQYNDAKVKLYIESLFLILRNKVLTCYGNLSKTKIVWFYPISMTPHRFNLFSREWVNAYKKYFGDELTNIIPMTESIAPYKFYKSAVGSAGNMVNVDIGGGTSDIVFANNGTANYITSFHFAANSIFGDGYASVNAGNDVHNGIISSYMNQMRKILVDNSLDDLIKIFDDYKIRNSSADLASFFFSLKDNYDIQQKHISSNVDFSNMLQFDSKFKIIFLIFYTAIIYHLAHIMKEKDLGMPRHITFSGNGSKVITILSANKRTLEAYTKIIFEKIYKQKYPTNGLSIYQNADNPKEVTCKGGITNPEYQDYNSIKDTKIVLMTGMPNYFVGNEKYSSIGDDAINECAHRAEEFMKFVLELNDSDYSFKSNFGVTESSLKVVRDECFKDLATYSRNGLIQKKKEASDNDVIEETMFFYPLNGMLNALASAIYNNETEE